jgi:hypothetical protein
MQNNENISSIGSSAARLQRFGLCRSRGIVGTRVPRGITRQ